jgi:hypothetical protein
MNTKLLLAMVNTALLLLGGTFIVMLIRLFLQTIIIMMFN